MNKAVLILKNTIKEAEAASDNLIKSLNQAYENVATFEQQIDEHIAYIQELEEALKVLEKENV